MEGSHESRSKPTVEIESHRVTGPRITVAANRGALEPYRRAYSAVALLGERVVVVATSPWAVIVALHVIAAAIIHHLLFAVTFMMMGVGGETVPAVSASYTGPGDVVSGATAWWGLRCYNNAYSGNVAAVWDGATGNTTETLLTCSPGGTINQTVNSLSTTCAVSCVIATLYDQTGNSHDVTQATNSQRPTFTQSCLGSNPCAAFLGSSTQLLKSAATIGTLTQPNTLAMVSIRTGAFTTKGAVFGDSTGNLAYAYSNTANQIAVYNGTNNATSAVSDSAWQSMIYILQSTSSVFYLNAVSTTISGNPGTNSISGSAQLGEDDYGDKMTGDLMELGVWNSGFNSTQATNMCHNQYLYYGTPTSC